MLSVDPQTLAALDYLTERYGLTRSATIRLAVRRMAEAEGWERGKAQLVAAS
jgi:hypothetical protein